MEKAKAFCFSLGALSLLAAIVREIAPENMQRQLGMVVNLLLLLFLLTPLQQIRPDGWRWPSLAAKSDLAALSTDPLLEQEVESRLEAVLSENLEQAGIFPDAVRIDITVAQGEVTMGDVNILLRASDGSRQRLAQDIAWDCLKTKATVQLAREAEG